MLSEDTEGERSSDQGTSPQQDAFRLEINEVLILRSCLAKLRSDRYISNINVEQRTESLFFLTRKIGNPKQECQCINRMVKLFFIKYIPCHHNL